jgi:methionyl aminopeptidase
MRPVPAQIPRPEYVGKPAPSPSTDPWVQPPEVIEAMRVAGRIAAQALAEGGRAVAPGVRTDEIDWVVHEFLCDHGAYPSTLGYKGFPKSCCTSLNEVICHGIPDSTLIEDGDIVNIDVTGFIGGVHGDTNGTFLAGEVAEEHRLLVERTHEAMARDPRGEAGPGAQRGRPRHRVLREAVRLRRGAGLHRARHWPGHGTREFFRWRAELTQRLVAEKDSPLFPWRETGQIAIECTAASSAPPSRMWIRERRWRVRSLAAVDVGQTRRSWSSRAGCAATTTGCRRSAE